LIGPEALGLQQVDEVVVATGKVQCAEARGGAVEMAADVLVGAERHACDPDELVGPSRGHLRRGAELAPGIGESLDVRDAIFRMGLEQALQPRLSGRLIGWRRRDDLDERGDGISDRCADRPRRAVHLLEGGGDLLQKEHCAFGREYFVLARNLLDLRDGFLDALDGGL
jgi:hypothetical protein